jgi:pSer/pThr/pTyr-binding forkhead associated (FHA) protein
MLDAEVTRVGRHPDSDIFLDDITVSRRHAEIIRQADGFHLRDVGSLNGPT